MSVIGVAGVFFISILRSYIDYFGKEGEACQEENRNLFYLSKLFYYGKTSVEVVKMV